MATVYEHKYVLFEKLGPGHHPCHWCGRSLEWRRGTDGDALVADHLDSDPRNNDPSNLVASCNGCNTIRARQTRTAIKAGELHVVSATGSRTRAVSLSCEICGAHFLADVSRVTRGTVSTCSRRCAGIKGAQSRWGIL